MEVPALIKKVASGEKTHKDLTEAEAYFVMTEVLAGRLSDLQVGALLATLRLKGEAVDELAGFLRAVQESTVAIPLVAGPVVAHCGVTAGKGHSFLAAPAATMLAVAAGVKVLVCGRTGAETRFPLTDVDVYAALGITTMVPPGAAGALLAERGLAVVEQRLYHPALARLAAMRVPLGMRTVAQSLEKLVFPLRPTAVIVSAFHLNYLRRLSEAAGRVYDFRLVLMQERDGATDLVPAVPTKGFVVDGGQVSDWQVTPEEAGLERQTRESLPPLDLAETVAVTRDVLAGRLHGPHREMVLYSAGLLMQAGGLVPSLPEGVARARGLLETGAGDAVLARVSGRAGR